MIAIVPKLIILLILLFLALLSDLRTYKIKNSITYAFMFVGLTANATMKGFEGIIFSLNGIMLPAVCLLILYIMKIIGAGDVKLLSAIGAIMGAGFAFHASVFSFLCGGVIASVIMLRRHNGAERFRYLILYIKNCLLSGLLLQYADFKDKQAGGRFHFSIAVAAGTVLVAVARGLDLAIL